MSQKFNHKNYFKWKKKKKIVHSYISNSLNTLLKKWIKKDALNTKWKRVYFWKIKRVLLPIFIYIFLKHNDPKVNELYNEKKKKTLVLKGPLSQIYTWFKFFISKIKEKGRDFPFPSCLPSL